MSYSGEQGSQAWPITAAAPQRIRTVFPLVFSCSNASEEKLSSSP
jgi:hypothetical protein